MSFDRLDPVAVYGAVVATGVLVWDIMKWLREGPRLKLRVIAPMQIVTRGGKPDDRTLVSITATNVGSKETVINLLAMAYWPSFLHMMLDKKRRDMVVPDPTIPGSIYVIPFDLGVGKQWTGAIDYKDEIREMANKGRLYFRVYHTLASKPATARIRDSFATKEAKPS